MVDAQYALHSSVPTTSFNLKIESNTHTRKYKIHIKIQIFVVTHFTSSVNSKVIFFVLLKT